MPNILGIKISSLTAQEIRQKIAELLNENKSHYLVTPNPEIILAAHEDEELFYILNQADLAPADGVGLHLAAWLYKTKISRLAGADLVPELLIKATKEKRRTLILNWRGGLSKPGEISATLQKKFPGLDFLIIDSGRTWPESILPSDIIRRIKDFSPQIIFCTFGSPYQEKIIYHNFRKFPGLRLSLGVGGAFDFLSGKIKRAPNLLRRLGLEWFWRLLCQPSRYKRIYQATVVFSLKILKARFLYTYLYRPNVACLLFKYDEGIKKILLVERSDDPGHWQLPQGGLDGETLEKAGRRELREETGVISLETKGVFKNLYCYHFPLDKIGGAESKEHKYDYKGQRQGLYIAEFKGSDREIKINFWDHSNWKWVQAENLVESVHPVRKEAAQKFLEKFNSLNL